MKIVSKRYTVPVLFFAALLMFSENVVRGEESASSGKVEFGRIWDLVKSNSPGRRAAAAESEAAEIMKNRQGRHWLPRIYAEGRGYVTNDPGLAFMSNMGQRSVIAEDFNPDTLNKPGNNLYQKGTIGIEFPVYEGGAGIENAKAAEKIAEAKRYTMNSVQLNEFSSAASAYGQLIVLLRTGAELKQLHERVGSVLGNYQGSLKSNPVEYSGILGLRALKNRIEAMTAENDAKIVSLRTYIVKMSGNGISPGWIPSDADAVDFADTYLKGETESGDSSYMVKAYNAYADSAKSMAEAGKSVFFPKIGVFSEANIYNGERDTADSYSAGFYIRMNLVSPTDYGSVKQAELQSEAARDRARDARLKEEIELRRLAEFSATLKGNIKKLKESRELMDEQLRNSQRLYMSGAIKSFQLADVFSRKADLLISLAAAESEYVAVKSGIYNCTGRASWEVKHDR